MKPEKMLTSLLIIFLVLLSFHYSCVSEPRQNNSFEDTEISNSDNDPQIPPSVMKRGENAYNSYCLACHQSDGSGNPGMYPPLNETKTVNGNKRKLIKIVLEGLSGEIEVKGESYNQVMVPHNFLTDQQIADILTYIRNSFGNYSSMILKNTLTGRGIPMNM
jgi:mono/diheme cytochrome c family protein